MYVSQPDDAAEIEADAIADTVMRMPSEERMQAPSSRDSANKIHRKCRGCEREDEEKIHRKPLGSGRSISGDEPSHIREAITSGGRPLDRRTRAFFEPRFGFDLGSVRLHTGSAAERSARAVDAKAYTIGNHIVFSANSYDPSAVPGKHLLAHELAHVVQGSSGREIRRQPDERRICVPGSSAPECAKTGATESEEGQKPGTTVVVTGAGMALPSGIGLQVPSHPDAVKGIHDWSGVYGTANRAKNTNRFRVGTFRLQQICQPDTTGAWAVYVYFVIDADGDRYAVGPDSLLQYVMRHGGVLVADARNTDQLGTDRKMLDPRQLPAAADAFNEEPTIYYAAPRLPLYDEISDAFHVGYYSIRGYLRRRPDGTLAVLYYVASNVVSLFRPEYVIGPNWIKLFTERQGGYGLIAELSYPLEPGAMPPAYQIHSARFVLGTMKGDVERAESGLEAWKSAAKDPGWWMQIAMSYAGAAQGPRPTPRPSGPPIRGVIQGGKSGTAPIVSEPIVGTGGAPRSSAYVGKDNAARALAFEPAPSVPAVAPRHLQSVPMPTGPPAPAPTPMSPLGSTIGVGASSSIGTGLALGPDVDIDLDKKRRRGGCSYQSIGQQFGRYPCHAAYATKLSGVPREVRVTSPDRWSADFDAMDHGGMLYEVKTGYRWLVFMANDEARSKIITRFWAQATNQLLIAGNCGHQLRWYFNDPYVASFFGAENSPHPEYFGAPLPVPVWYVPFDCDRDSD